jgi:signal transduction histidine kinase
MEGLPDTEEYARRTELANALERRSHEIVDRWFAQVRADARAARVPPTALIDGIADYMTRLAELLRSEKSLDSAGTAAWTDVAREHAITRVKLGFDVMQLGHELVVLRRVITEVLLEQGLLRDIDQLARLTDLIEAAMNASIKTYVDYRDYETRRSEAEHIGFLTHELRNPLAAVTMAVSRLRRPDLSTGEARLFEILDRNIERLGQMINDVLLTERLQAAEIECRSVDVTLGALLGDVIDVRQRAAREKGIEFRANFDPGMQLHVDPKLTLSVFENLIDNAIKFTDTGEVTVDVDEKPGEIVVHVRDHCGGLSAEELRVIFEPFRRAHSNKPGTGLGLAIARRAVEAQGGRIEAESTTDAGCHFWFTLPRSQQ